MTNIQKGTIKNISGGTLNIYTLGWRMDAGVTETVDPTVASNHKLRLAEEELEALIASGDIEVKYASGSTVATGKVFDWIDVQYAVVSISAGTGISIDYDGEEEGTGNVVINSLVEALKWWTYAGSRHKKAFKQGISWLSHDAKWCPHNELGFWVPEGTIRTLWVTTNDIDTSTSWYVKLYLNPTSPSRVLKWQGIMTTGSRVYEFSPDLVVPVSGEYGIAFARHGGSNSHSDWTLAAAGIKLEVSA